MLALAAFVNASLLPAVTIAVIVEAIYRLSTAARIDLSSDVLAASKGNTRRDVRGFRPTCVGARRCELSLEVRSRSDRPF